MSDSGCALRGEVLNLGRFDTHAEWNIIPVTEDLNLRGDLHVIAFSESFN